MASITRVPRSVANTLTARVALGGPDRHGYVPLLRHLHAASAREPLEPWVSVAEAAELAADGLLAWHYRPEHRALFETAAFERELDGSVAGPGGCLLCRGSGRRVPRRPDPHPGPIASGGTSSPVDGHVDGCAGGV